MSKRFTALGGVNRRKLRFVLLVLIPIVMGYLLFTLYPVLKTIYISLFDWHPLMPEKPFVGLDNYRLLFEDKVFWVSLWNTVYFCGVTAPLGTIVALVLALLLKNVKRFASLFRTIFYLPVITSMVAAAVVWRFVYQPRFGLLNLILRQLHLPEAPWLESSALAMPSIMAMDIWKSVGYAVVIFLAGLQSIPRVHYEAAEIDGASPYNTFRFITLPLLKPTILLVLVIRLIEAFQVFTQVYVMTRPVGGPVHATRVLVVYLYSMSFYAMRMGYGACIAVILFFIIFFVTIIQFKLLHVDWEY